jgi:hypothetical protein
MPPPIGRRRIEEFRRAFGGEIDSLAALYRNAAADMMQVVGDASATLFARQRAIAYLRQYQAILADLRDEAAAWIEMNIPRAYHVGLEFADEGARNIRKAGVNLGRRQREVFSQVHREAAQAVMEEMMRTSDFALAQIGRRANDVFRRVGIEEVAKGIAEGKSRIEVTRQIKDRLLREGRPYFTDALGRQWDLDRYGEMVARTTTREAMTQGTINRLREHRIQLAQVSAHNAADFCIYYENVVVSLTGESVAGYPPISAINGGPPFHPNCIPAGTRVLTPRGWREIEDIRIGDVVMTHRGRPREVTAVMVRAYAEALTQIGALYLTPDHPVLTRDGWQAAWQLGARDEVAVLEQSEDRLRSEFRPLAIADADDLEAKSGDLDITGGGSGNAVRFAPVVNLDGQARAGEEEVRDVALNRVLENVCHHGGIESITDSDLMATGVAAIRGGAPFRDVVERRRPLRRVGSAHSCDIALVGFAGAVRDPAGLGPAPRPSIDAVAREPVSQQVRIPDAQLRGDLLERLPLGIDPCEELTERLSCSGRQLLLADDGSHDRGLAFKLRSVNYRGMVYNIAVAEDESYIAEGVVVHNCAHVLTPFVLSLATDKEQAAGRIEPDLLNKTPAKLQRRFRKDFPERARAEGKRMRQQGAAAKRRAERPVVAP